MGLHLLNESVVEKLLIAIEAVDDGFRLDGKETVILKRRLGEFRASLKNGVAPDAEMQFVRDLYEWATSVGDYAGNNSRAYKPSELEELLQNVKTLESFCYLLLNSEISHDDVNYRFKKLLIKADEIDDRAAQWEEKFNNYSIRMDKTIGEFIKEQRELAKVRIEEALISVEKDRVKVKEETMHLSALISKMASLKLSEEFMDNALTERASANLFRRVSLIVMAGIGALSFILFVILELDLPSAQHTLARLAMALFFTFIVAYTARQSALHRAQEHSYMRKAMDLNAITPYLASMPDDSRNAIKGQLAQKLFAPADAQNGCDSANFGLLEVVNKLTDKIPKAPVQGST